MKYKRNWAWESTADVYFKDGSERGAVVLTDNKGRLRYLTLDGKCYCVNAENLDDLGIEAIHFTTPAKLQR